MGIVCDFAAAKRKRDPLIVAVGDTVEWVDFDMRLYKGTVESILNSREQSCKWIHLTNPSPFHIHLGTGLSVISTSVTKKIVPEREPVKVKLRFPSYKKQKVK